MVLMLLQRQQDSLTGDCLLQRVVVENLLSKEDIADSAYQNAERL